MSTSKGMISGDWQLLRKTSIDPLAIVYQGGRLAVENFSRRADISTIYVKYALSGV